MLNAYRWKIKNINYIKGREVVTMSDFRNVKGMAAIVTGAARGIGFGTAETLASEGVHVVMSDILPILDDSCEKVKKAYPDAQVYAKAADVSDEAAVKALVDFTVEKFGKLDIMVNNAGMHMDTGNVWETDMAKVDKIMSVNFKGEFHGCKAIFRVKINNKSPDPVIIQQVHAIRLKTF